MSSLWMIIAVSMLWAIVAVNQLYKRDYSGFAISIGIVITNTGFAYQLR